MRCRIHRENKLISILLVVNSLVNGTALVKYIQSVKAWQIQVKFVLFFQCLWEMWWKISWDHIYVPLSTPLILWWNRWHSQKDQQNILGIMRSLEIRELGDICVVTITSFPYHTCRDGGTRLVNSLLCTWFKLMEFGFLKSGFINRNAQLGSQVEMQYSSEY